MNSKEFENRLSDIYNKLIVVVTSAEGSESHDKKEQRKMSKAIAQANKAQICLERAMKALGC